MTEQTTHKVDRKGWPAGPWDKEPDRIEWRHKGFPCLMVRNNLGAWCGYVGVSPEHKLFGIDYSSEFMPSLDAHGGLTYASACRGHICHVPKAGETDRVWWLGFDCAHSGDLVPGMVRMLEGGKYGRKHTGYLLDGDVYRDAAYVTREVNKLAEQIAEVK